MLRRAEVGETPPDDGVVEPGMVVTYKFVGDDDDEAEKFLLGAREIEAPEGLTVYSPQSAMGAAINGKHKGDKVSYTTEAGKTFEVEILDAVPYQG
jgi:transcription elongation factor GreA